MFTSFTFICALVLAGGPTTIDSFCRQVAPPTVNGRWTRTVGCSRAVVLIHGFHYQALAIHVPKAELRPWQGADAVLVKELAKNADVYSFGYGQNVPLDAIVRDSKLPPSIAYLRKLGYDDIALVGHSAGGLIARHFVEDFPDAGVTRVAQICAPNGGSPLAKMIVHKNQKPFLECLTEKHRRQCLKERADKTIPESVQFLCVVGKGDGGVKVTDGVVPCACQWTADLQTQGVPAFAVPGGHREIVRDPKFVETITRLLREPQPRWPPDRVDRAKAEIFGPRK